MEASERHTQPSPANGQRIYIDGYPMVIFDSCGGLDRALRHVVAQRSYYAELWHDADIPTYGEYRAYLKSRSARPD